MVQTFDDCKEKPLPANVVGDVRTLLIRVKHLAAQLPAEATEEDAQCLADLISDADTCICVALALTGVQTAAVQPSH